MFKHYFFRLCRKDRVKMKQSAFCRALLNTQPYISRQCLSSSVVEALPQDQTEDQERIPSDIPGPPALPVIGTLYKYLPGGTDIKNYSTKFYYAIHYDI